MIRSCLLEFVELGGDTHSQTLIKSAAHKQALLVRTPVKAVDGLRRHVAICHLFHSACYTQFLAVLILLATHHMYIMSFLAACNGCVLPGVSWRQGCTRHPCRKQAVHTHLVMMMSCPQSHNHGANHRISCCRHACSQPRYHGCMLKES